MSQYVKKIRTEAGDLQIDYNALANLPELNTMFSNPNLLINSDFRKPINQRGLESYSNANDDWKWSYTIDRWAFNASKNSCVLTVNDSSITITNNGSQSMHFRQLFERSYVKGNYTATINVLSVSGSVTVHFDDGNKSSDLSVGLNTITLNATPEHFNFLIGGGVSIELAYVKLEPGNMSTPFVPKLHSEELGVCRRYYRKYWTSMLMPQFYENQYCGFFFETPMVRDPVVKTFSILSTSDGSSVGANVEVYAQGVYKFFAINGYAEKAIIVPMLELDAEIY